MSEQDDRRAMRHAIRARLAELENEFRRSENGGQDARPLAAAIAFHKDLLVQLG